MSGDGASLHVDAKSAIGKILGGKDIPDEAIVTAAEFENRIRNTSYDQELDYGSCADAAARIILEAYEAYPQLRDLSDERIYLRNKAGDIEWSNPIALNVTLYDVIKKLHPEGTAAHDKVLDALSGFMWGWAMNAARTILGLGPVPNPALITIPVGDAGGGATIDELLGDE